MQQRQPRLLILTALAGAFAVSVAFAQTATETVRPESTSPARDSTTPAPIGFDELDTDGDHAISKEEAAKDPPLAQAFDTLDKDADGQLSPAEYEAYNVAGGR